ncbi:major head protein [Vibrio phage K58 g2]
MKVTQLHTLVNTVTQEVLGESVVLNEDLTNVVEIGTAVFDANSVDNYVKKLVDHIGKVIFVNRAYAGGAPSLLMDSWEFGSVLEKISTGLPDAQENDSWNLTDGQDYSQDVFKAPDVAAKFYSKRVTFEIQMSFTEKQFKSAFSSAEQLNGFVSMLHQSVENSLTVKLDALIMRTINNMIGETKVSDSTGVKAVNLLAEFNVSGSLDAPITAAEAINNPNFIRFATYRMGVISDRMTRISTLFNVGGQPRFTPSDLQRVVLLSDFAKASETYVLADSQNPDKVTLPKHDSVPYWQGSGEDYGFDSVSKIDIKTAGGDTVTVTGVLGAVFDRDAVAVSNMDRRTTVSYNARAEFFNNWFKADAQYINDLNENFVFFYVEDAPAG